MSLFQLNQEKGLEFSIQSLIEENSIILQLL